MNDVITVSSFRAERQLTLAELGELVGLSKSQMHEVERTGRASLRVAIAIEDLSGGRIDAAALNDDVALARIGALQGSNGAGGAVVHAAGSNTGGAQDHG